MSTPNAVGTGLGTVFENFMLPDLHGIIFYARLFVVLF